MMWKCKIDVGLTSERSERSDSERSPRAVCVCVCVPRMWDVLHEGASPAAASFGAM